MVVHARDPSTGEADTGRSRVQGHSGLIDTSSKMEQNRMESMGKREGREELTLANVIYKELQDR